jgi:hypothetical protein
MYDDLPMSSEALANHCTVHGVLKERCSAVYSDRFEAHDAEEGLSFVIRGETVHIFAWRTSSEAILRSLAVQSLEGNLRQVEGKLCYTTPLDGILWIPAP